MINFVILLSVLFSSMAQILLKRGMNHCQCEFSLSTANIMPLLNGLVLNPSVMGGVFLHVLALITWLYVLKHVDVSYAYPFISLGFVLVLILGYFFFNEDVNLYRVAGVAAIMLGIILISRSAA
jgi:multidrug transporter EmrE-like cation transporter